jgi:hypothetical protein
MKVYGVLAWVLIAAGCGLLAVSVPAPKPSPKAAHLLAEGGYVEAYVMRRFADGRLLVRLQEGGGVWFLDPKVNCPWCWTYVDKKVWAKLDKRSVTLLNPKGETAQFWNGGPVDKY